MPDSYWRGPLAYLALGVLCASVVAWIAWHVSADLAEERIRGEKTAEYHDNYAEQAIDQECLGLELPALRDCIHEQIETARDHERSEQDLDAQQAMARFTKVMGWTAVVGVVLGAGSVVLIFLTLRATQDMARETTRIGEAQVRAYITIENVKVNPRPKQDKVFWELFATIRNSGQSPARGIETFAYVNFSDGPKMAGSHVQDLAAGQECETKIITSSQEAHFLPNSDTKVLFSATIGVRFRDVFNTTTEARNVQASQFTGIFDLVEGNFSLLSPHQMISDIVKDWGKS